MTEKEFKMDSNNNVPRGPEDIPLKTYIKDFQVVVLIKDIKSNRYIREEKINYSDVNVRKWLGRISFWAWTNGYLIETMSLTDYENK